MRAWSPILVACMATAVFAGCISDTTDDGLGDLDNGWSTALGNYTLPETITGLDEMQQMQFTFGDGTVVEGVSVDGIWFHDNLLYTSGRPGMMIVDVSDPLAPVTLAVMDEDTVSRDVDIMEHPNGNLYAVLAGAPGIILVNVTDPTAPEVTSTVRIGYHNIAVVPGTTLVYNSRSVYTGPAMDVGGNNVPDVTDPATKGGLADIIDFSDPENPVVTEFRFPRVVTTVGGIPKVSHSLACHDISVYPEVDRAYCAGITETQVWDISDPKAPVILQIIDNPGTNIHHAAYAARNHTLLVIGDELGGAALSPGCAVSDQPYGGVWFVDISDLSMPTPVGWWAPQEAHEEPVRVDPDGNLPVSVPTCTAHFGNFVEDRDLLVMGFYTAGVFLIDFSDPANPVEIANYRPGGNVWEGQYYRGYVYTGDTARGVDVLQPVGDGSVLYE